MSAIKDFLKGFSQRGGVLVALSSILLKFCSLFISIFIVRFISKEDLGNITFAMSLISLFSVFAGFGSNWSLLRFGPRLNSYLSKYQLFRFSIHKGSIYTIFVFITIGIVGFFLPNNIAESQKYLIILGIGLFSSFLLESLLSYFRILNLNKIYSKANSIGSLISLLVTFVLVYFFNDIGYVCAIVLAPLITFLFFSKHVFFLKKIDIKFELKNSFNKNEYFKYGVYTGLGMIANQLVISSGGMLAGYYGASSSDIALFKVATIIPFNLMFIPLIIMTSDFVHFAKNQDDKNLLQKYYLNYFKTILLTCGLPILLFIIFNQEIIELLFGKEYKESSLMSLILMIGIFFSFLFRIPLGNILSAVGKANWNVVHSVTWLILFIPISLVLYNMYGILGIAYTISIVLIISGFVSLLLFKLYLKKLS